LVRVELPMVPVTYQQDLNKEREMKYNMPAGSLQDLQMQMALLDHMGQQAEHQSGKTQRWLHGTEDRQAQQAAQSLQNYLAMSQQFPTMQPPPQLQKQAGALFGGPQDRLASMVGVNTSGVQIPKGTPHQSQTQAMLERYNQVAPAETEQQIQSVYRLAKELGIPEDQMPQFMMGALGMGGKTLTPYQETKLGASKAGIIKSIEDGVIVDSTGFETASWGKDEASQRKFIAAVTDRAMRAGIDVNDPEIVAAIQAKMAPKDKKGKGIDWAGLAKGVVNLAPSNWQSTLAQKGMQKLQAPKVPKLQALIRKNAKAKALYDQAHAQFPQISDDEILAFLEQQGL
jgi:hypothetical protein